MKKYLTIAFILILTTSAITAEPQLKTYFTQSDFEDGEVKGISITSKGKLQLAPRIEKICETEEPAIWSIVADKKGKIFFSAGNEGKIFTIDKKQKLKLFCQLEEIEIYALTVDKHNTLFAGTSPDGKVYRISPTGKATILFDPPDKYIWDLLFDDNNNLFVATGDSGLIYKVAADGKSSIFYKSDEQHIRCLNRDTKGNMLAGSYGNGYIYRFNEKGEAFVIYDADIKEIHQVEVAPNGTIYAAGLGQMAGFPQLPATTKPETKRQGTDNTAGNNGNDDIVIGEITIEAPRPKSISGKMVESAIFKITPRGMITDIWNYYREPVQSIISINDNELIVGTGKSGKLFHLSGNNEKTILLGLDEAQISAFCETPQGEIYFATSNLGKLYKLQRDFRSRGEYYSEVFDSYATSKWGTIQWEAVVPSGCEVQFFTRTGNTEKPNSTWSKWSGPYTNPIGENINSPEARFIQWKLQLSSRKNNITPKIEKVTISYLQQNLPPTIHSITIYKPGEYYRNSQAEVKSSFIGEEMGIERGTDGSQSSDHNQYLGHKSYRKGYRTATWAVSDENNDKLIYDLYYREQDERFWKKLALNWKSTSFSWDSHRMPDGIYLLKLEASDSLSNPKNLALKTSLISDPFIIDNSGPEVKNLAIKKKGKAITITATIKDKFTPIKEVTYSVDGSEWEKAYPIDGICDSKSEKFNIKTNYTPQAGSHTVIIRATDYIKNIGFGRLFFED